MRKAKILILGAKGMLGQELSIVFSNQQAVLWDREEIDIADKKQVEKKITKLKPEIIINAAAYNAVDEIEKEENFELAKKINGYGVGYLAKTAKEIGAMLIHYSTGYVFDGEKQSGYQEDDQPNPISRYAQSKYLGEQQLSSNTDKFYLIRTNLLFGKPAIFETAKKSFVETMLSLAKRGDRLNVVFDEISNPTYAVDLAQATFKLIEDNYLFGIYHLVNQGQASWYDWAKEIFSIRGIKKELVKITAEQYLRPAKRPKCSVLINTKFLPLRPWQKALKEYLST